MSDLLSNIDKQALRVAAVNAKLAGEAPIMPFDQRISALNDFMKYCTPATVLALLDKLEAAKKRVGELEARKVKMLERYDIEMWPIVAPHGEWYFRDDVLAALVAAGVKFTDGTGEGE